VQIRYFTGEQKNCSKVHKKSGINVIYSKTTDLKTLHFGSAHLSFYWSVDLSWHFLFSTLAQIRQFCTFATLQFWSRLFSRNNALIISGSKPEHYKMFTVHCMVVGFILFPLNNK
jgi:hypothetical protein